MKNEKGFGKIGRKFRDASPNKRGQELSIGTLILIVLGIVVLVLLILGFSLGWQNLFERIGIFTGGSGIESVIEACKISAASESEFSYCADLKQVRISGNKQYVTCEDSRVLPSIDNPLDCVSYKPSLIEACKTLEPSETNSVMINGKEIASAEACADL